MTRANSEARANEVVSLAQRLRYLEAFRAVVAVLVLVGTVLWRLESYLPQSSFVLATAVYVALAVAGGTLWRLGRQRGLTIFGALIIIDGIYLAWVSYASGGPSSPFRYLIVLHLVTVTLLAAYRTGLKLALWHSLLLLTTFHLVGERIIPVVGGQADVSQTASFMAVFWLAAFSTATFAAVNERELRRRKVDMEALAVMAAMLESAAEPKTVARVLASNVSEHFDFGRVTVLQLSDRKLTPLVVHGERYNGDSSCEPDRGSVVVEALEERRTRLASELDPEVDGWLEEILPGARNLLIVPMSAEGGALGVVVAEHGRGAEKIARRTVDMVERFASHGALALRGAFLLEEVRRLASTDALTKIANRRTFDQVLARELERARKQKSALSLIIADIDHFKDVNDEYGHQAGDRLLRELASFLVRRVRSIDVVARYGGEEFAIIMPKCAPAEAAVRAEQLRLALADARLSHRVSVSFGVAAYPDHANEASKLIVAADEALYRSKAAGRDRLTVFEIDATKTRSATSRNGSRVRARAKSNSERRRRDVA